MTKEDVIARAKESIAIEAKAIADIAGYISQFSRCTPDLPQKGDSCRFPVRSGQCIQRTVSQL